MGSLGLLFYPGGLGSKNGPSLGGPCSEPRMNTSRRLSTLSGKALTLSGKAVALSGEILAFSGKALIFSAKALSFSGRAQALSGKAPMVSRAIRIPRYACVRVRVQAGKIR